MIYSSSTPATPGGVCVYLSGEVDISVSDHLYQTLVETLDQTVGPVEVNLRELRLLDCTGLTALIRARHYAARRRRVLFVSQAHGIVRRVLDFVGTLTEVPPGSSTPCAADRRRLAATVGDVVLRIGG
jgi:anti-anti-sigma factor